MNDESRKAFEELMRSLPYERDISIFKEHEAWPGNYKNVAVDLAFCAWKAAVEWATQRQKEKSAKLMKELAEHALDDGKVAASDAFVLAESAILDQE